MSLPISPITGQPSALTAAVRRSVGIGAPQQQQPQGQPRGRPVQKSLSIERAVKAAVLDAVEPLAAGLQAMIYAAGGDVQKAHYQAPPRTAGTNTAGQITRRDTNHQVRRMAHIFSQTAPVQYDAVTLANMAKQQSHQELQNAAAVYRASYGHGYEATKPGLSASPAQLAAHAEPADYRWHNGLVSV